jgi:uncharacterized lipoprotein YmbA
MSLRLALNAVVLATGLAIYAGCTTSSAKPELHRYMLAVNSPSIRIPATTVVQLHEVTGSAPFRDSAIAYQTSPYRLDSYSLHRWVSPPTEMVAQTLNDLVNQPVPGSASADPVLVLLDARIKSFQQVTEGNKNFGLVEIEFCLTPNQRQARPLWCQAFRHQNPAYEDSAEAAAQAISLSFSQVITDFSAELLRRTSVRSKL